jgi:hypothetical protein
MKVVRLENSFSLLATTQKHAERTAHDKVTPALAEIVAAVTSLEYIPIFNYYSIIVKYC